VRRESQELSVVCRLKNWACWKFSVAKSRQKEESHPIKSYKQLANAAKIGDDFLRNCTWIISGARDFDRSRLNGTNLARSLCRDLIKPALLGANLRYDRQPY
jgi:hypothetical protein